MNATVVEFVREGVALRSRPDAPYLHLLSLVVLMCLRDGHRSVRIARAGTAGEMHSRGDAGPVEMVPPPAHIVDALYRLLAEGNPPRPRWWNVRAWLRRPPEPPAVPPCWSGVIEARFGGVRVPLACDLIAYPDGVSIVLEVGGTSAERAGYARAAEAATAARRARVGEAKR
jgi:hypothetical protein